jgi:6-methylsalicylate decarboxylase
VTFTVDTHYYMLPDFFWRATNEADRPVGGIAPPPWSRASTLSFLDDAGIDVAVTSISTPACTPATTPRPAYWPGVQRTGRRHDPRPPRPVRRLRVPTVAGRRRRAGRTRLRPRRPRPRWRLAVQQRPRHLARGTRGSPPLFDELQRRAAVVFAHPNRSPDPSAHALELPDTLIDFAADTTRAIAQLHYSSTFARTPDVKDIFARAGRTAPYLAGRFGIIEQVRVIPGAEGRATAAETFRRLYWDTAACWVTRAAHAARGRGNRPRRIRHRLPLPAPRSGRLLPRPHRGHPGTHRRRADGRPRRHGHDADPATGHPASQDPDPRFITRPGHP